MISAGARTVGWVSVAVTPDIVQRVTQQRQARRECRVTRGDQARADNGHLGRANPNLRLLAAAAEGLPHFDPLEGTLDGTDPRTPRCLMLQRSG